MTYIFLRYTVHVAGIMICAFTVILCAVRTAAYTACRRVIIFFCRFSSLSLGSVCLVTGLPFCYCACCLHHYDIVTARTLEIMIYLNL